VEYITLGKDLRISRVLTGLWQIADMERDGKELSPDTAARAMEPVPLLSPRSQQKFQQ